MSLVVFSVLVIFLSYFIIIGFAATLGSLPPLFSIILLVWFFVIFYTLQYGLMVTVFKMVTNERTFIGHLFAGFKNFKQVSGAGILTFAGMFVLNLIILTPYTLFDKAFPPLFTYSLVPQGIDLEIGITLLFIISMAVYSAVLLLCSVLFAFIPFIFEQNPHIKVLRAFKGCFILLKGRFRHFISCIIKGVWPLLLVTSISFALTVIHMVNPLPSFLLKFSNLVQTVCANLLLLKTYFIFAAYYQCLYEESRNHNQSEQAIAAPVHEIEQTETFIQD